MPYDLQTDQDSSSKGLRDQVLELMSRKSLDPSMSEDQYRAALRTIVTCTGQASNVLLNQYHGCQADTCSITYAKYGY